MSLLTAAFGQSDTPARLAPKRFRFFWGTPSFSKTKEVLGEKAGVWVRYEGFEV